MILETSQQKFGQIWIIQSRYMIFQRFHFLYVALSGGTLLISVMSQQYNCLMELYTNFYKILLFMKMCLPSSLLRLLGLRWMCLNLIKRTIDIQEIFLCENLCNVQSQWGVVLLWYHIFGLSSIQRGRHTQLCIITSVKWIIQICSTFYCWVCIIAFYSPSPHCCLGKLPLQNMKQLIAWWRPHTIGQVLNIMTYNVILVCDAQW